MPLEPVPKDLSSAPAIYQDNLGELWEAIGYINSPATVLRNVKTGVQHVEVIGCLNAERFTRLRPVS